MTEDRLFTVLHERLVSFMTLNDQLKKENETLKERVEDLETKNQTIEDQLRSELMSYQLHEEYIKYLNMIHGSSLKGIHAECRHHHETNIKLLSRIHSLEKQVGVLQDIIDQFNHHTESEDNESFTATSDESS